ncbi:MAG: DUF1272 domain-containing protein [Gammaproteobacteria bacterium]|nr:DUF1272 domain-containing protein [Gammaproteobacteria bacterium]MDD9957477.1 DUF1272 domain-containing protein [Gammaproteobacteria bacterium]
MLELRPNCEMCDKDLPPNATDACICSYECTFCESCVEKELKNVCPNCGGGFAPRPIRPDIAHREGIGLSHQPASDKRVLTRRTKDEIATFVNIMKNIPPEKR